MVILLEHYRRSHHALGRHRSISCKPIFDLVWHSNKRHLVRYYYYCHVKAAVACILHPSQYQRSNKAQQEIWHLQGVYAVDIHEDL